MEQFFQRNLNHLRTFYWVAKSGNFTRAGRVLALPKSTISRQIRTLEDHLATRLLERTTRRVALTEIGQLFLAHCERIITEAEEAERAITQYNSKPSGLLRVGVPATFARTFLTPVIPHFCHKYPEVKLELVIPGGRLDPLESLLDVVIRLGPLTDSSYIVRKLGAIQQGIFASRSYLKGSPELKAPVDLRKHRIISTGRGPRGYIWKLSHTKGGVEEVRFEPHLAVPDPVIVAELAARGLGIAIVPDFLIKAHRSLAPVLPGWRPVPVEFFALYPARQLTAPKLRVFLEELEAHLRL